MTAPSVNLRRRGRPPRETGDVSITRDALLRAGVAALTEKGYVATGLDEILRSINIPKGSFYFYFDSKESFGLAMIDSYCSFFTRKLCRFLDDEVRPPVQRLHDFMMDAKAGMARYEFRRGCLVGNLGQEMGALPDSFRNRLRAAFADWQARLLPCLREGQVRGDIRADRDCAKLAAFFFIGWEGAVLRAKLERAAWPLDLFAEEFLSGLAG